MTNNTQNEPAVGCPLERRVMPLPPVLDACCGGRMMWFDKSDERAFFIDKRQGMRVVDVGTLATKGRQPKIVAPNKVVDFTRMPFSDNTFHHVVFDPPHYEKLIGSTGVLAFSYGYLSGNWKDELRSGFAECFRVLKPNGTLIFKWCEIEIPLREVLALTPEKPLYGHRSGKKAQTHWVSFIKPCGTDDGA